MDTDWITKTGSFLAAVTALMTYASAYFKRVATLPIPVLKRMSTRAKILVGTALLVVAALVSFRAQVWLWWQGLGGWLLNRGVSPGVLLYALIVVATLVVAALVLRCLIVARDILGSASTSYVGVFPDNMEEVIGLIQATRKELLVAVDFPAYGCFSRPALYEDYRQSLLKICYSEDRLLKVVTYNDDYGQRAMLEQFEAQDSPKDEVFEKLKATPSYSTFFRLNKAYPKPENLEQLFDIIFRHNARMKADLAQRDPEAIIEVDDPLPVFLWIRDGEEAIFSFYNLKGSSREVSFRTTDHTLVRILGRIQSGYLGLKNGLSKGSEFLSASDGASQTAADSGSQ